MGGARASFCEDTCACPRVCTCVLCRQRLRRTRVPPVFLFGSLPAPGGPPLVTCCWTLPCYCRGCRPHIFRSLLPTDWVLTAALSEALAGEAQVPGLSTGRPGRRPSVVQPLSLPDAPVGSEMGAQIPGARGDTRSCRRAPHTHHCQELSWASSHHLRDVTWG